MIWLNISRIGKVLALLMFLLPWMAVSCNGAPLVQMSGVDMIVGKAEPSPDSPLAALAQQAEDRPAGVAADEDSPVNMAEKNEGMKLARFWMPASVILILLGLGLSFALKPLRKGATAALAASVAALVVLGGGMAWTSAEFRSAMNEATAESRSAPGADDPGGFGAAGREMAEAMAKAIKLEIKAGYWLTLAALVGAAGAAYMAMSGRSLPGVTITLNANRPPDSPT